MTRVIEFVKHNPRAVALIAVIIVLVIVTYMGYSGWQSAKDEQATVEKKEITARNNLNLAQDQYDLNKLRAEKESLMGSAKFPSSFPSVELSAYIAGAAEKYGVTLNSLTPKGAAGTETIGSQKYYRYETTVQISGSPDRMDLFMRYLEEGPFYTLRVENVVASPSSATFTVIILTQ